MKSETVAWESAHYQEPFHSMRGAKLPTKLEKLGVFDLDRNASILDACCGQGEALAALRERGFRRLTGGDGLEHPVWSDSPEIRFVQCDVRRMPFEEGEFDAIINLHSLHHMGGADGLKSFLAECKRVLKPGGKLFIIDFPGSVQVRLLFWALRHRFGAITPGLRNFAQILDEEWSYLGAYLEDWAGEQQVLFKCGLERIQHRQEFFLYYLTYTKHAQAGTS